MLVKQRENSEAIAEAGPPEDCYRFSEHNNGLDVSGTAETVSLSRTSRDLANDILLKFAPDGTATVTSAARFKLTCTATGREIEFPAASLSDVAALLTTFALQGEADAIPPWIRAHPDFRLATVCDDGDFSLRFCALALGPKSPYAVRGEVPFYEADAWGYQIVADEAHFGWIIMREPNCFVLTGIAKRTHSKHRTLDATTFRIATHLASLLPSKALSPA